MRAYERLLRYVKIDTPSDDDSTTVPSSPCQKELGRLLEEELLALGLSDAEMDEKGYVYATLPPTVGYENAVKLGFVAHMDTAPDFSGIGVNPRVIPDYDGSDVVLGDSGRVLRAADFPHLATLQGRTLIVTDGNTLLGADDKAGVAEIMTALEKIITEEIPHGKISVCFTPDEEVGRGADHFDVSRFGADFAYTVDGDTEGGIEYENFNAAGAEVTFHGFNIHPGDAKDKMINAALLALECNAMLPATAIPRHTSGYEGFFHLLHMEGSVEKASLSYIIRDHSAEAFEEKKQLLLSAVESINSTYGPGSAVCTITEQYRNMSEIIASCPHLIESAKAAAEAAGVTPFVKSIRGGTDGARLSFMGLPCPNLGTGGHAFHGPFEHITAEDMDAAVNILTELVKIYAGKSLPL